MNSSRYPVLPNTSTPRDPEAANARVVRKRVGGGYKYIIEKIDDKEKVKDEKEKEKEKTDEEFTGEVSYFLLVCKMHFFMMDVVVLTWDYLHIVGRILHISMTWT